MALMDPYGLELMSVQMWGIALGVASTGFLIGGAVVSARGLGRNPIRTMLLLVVGMGLVGMFFAIRDWWPLFVAGTWLYMAFVPAIEAAEQTVIQKVVPYQRQGRVFGFASAMEASAAPITAFLIAPIAQYLIIPYAESADGRASWGWLVGDGRARGIALIFFFAGLAVIALALIAFSTSAYRRLSAAYGQAPAEAGRDSPEPAPQADETPPTARGGLTEGPASFEGDEWTPTR
jgi:DHA3 family multidrug efflux protein-like MFS transporter